MTLKTLKVHDIKVIGYARRSFDHPNLSYIGWDKETAFDMPVVYQDDLINLDNAHKERYTELQSKLLQSFEVHDELCERIRELEQYISSHAFVSDEVDDYEIVEDDTMQDGLPSMEHNHSPD